jgi:transmembrane sensor
MSELDRQLAEVDAAFNGRFTDGRLGTLRRAALERARREERRRRAAGLGVGALSVVLAAVALWPVRPAPSPSVVSSPAPRVAPEIAARRLTFPDGSQATLLEADSDVRLVGAGRDVTVDLLAGAARFEIVRDPRRTFRVRAGLVSVDVLGTVFTVARGDAGAARVAVERGTVRVAWAGGERRLGAGETGRFPPEPPARAITTRAPGTQDRARDPSRGDWRRLARAGDYAGAFSRLDRAGGPEAQESPDDLLLAADVARLGGHPAQAVRPLARFLARHGADPRAQAAAMMLGRVYMDQLGAPAKAAAAFVDAERRAPRGPLAEDALARAADAFRAAGDAARAAAAARAYVQRFPEGQHRPRLEELLRSP